jgi:uncharacterized protein (TIGR02996 family)
MTRDAAFLQAILDAPDDDAPRLIYADWLDEHGDAARAEFIRLQCEAARLNPRDPRKKRLDRRWMTLFRMHHRDWDRPLLEALDCRVPPAGWIGGLVPLLRNQWPNPAVHRREYLRGFVGGVEIGMQSFLTHAKALFGAAPVQQVVFRSGTPERLPRLLESPYFSRLRKLELSAQYLDDADALALAQCSRLVGLTALNLDYNRIGSIGVSALAVSAHLRNLTDLSLAMNHFGDAGGQALAMSPYLDRLEVLDLRRCGAGQAAAALRRRFPHARITL